MRLRGLLFGVSMVVATLWPHAGFAGRPFDETLEERRGFHLFGGPSREGPEAQWERVQEHVENNRLRRAIRHAGYLADTWPSHPLAPEALRLRADLFFARGNYIRAFEAYQRLIDGYAGQIDYEEILNQQLEAATRTEQSTSWAVFGRYSDPLEAVPLYRQLVTNAPHLEIAPELVFRIGEIYMRKRRFSEAIQEFDLLEQRYPNSPFAIKAAWRRAEAFARIANRHPTDAGPEKSAWSAFVYFLETYPHAEEAEEAREREREFFNRIARRRYEQARFYEVNMRRPDTALAVYLNLVEQFPDSEWTERALQRIEYLSP